MAPVLVKQQTPPAAETAPGDTEAGNTEMVAFCPKCKTLETLWFSRDRLMPTVKFYQQDNRIYHDCGSSEPCRLYRAL